MAGGFLRWPLIPAESSFAVTATALTQPSVLLIILSNGRSYNQQPYRTDEHMITSCEELPHTRIVLYVDRIGSRPYSRGQDAQVFLAAISAHTECPCARH